MAEGQPARLLILNNGTARAQSSNIHEHFVAEGLHTKYYWAAGNEFPENASQFDGVLITGSPHGAYEAIPWISKEHQFLLEMASYGMPMLGICFGSQILASALVGRDQVFRRETCEVGFVDLDLTPEAHTDVLLAGQAAKLPMYVWHNDEVKAQHSDIRILASTPACPNQIWRYRNQSIWGVQGHPELTRANALASFDRNFDRLERDGADVDQLREMATDTPEAKRILKNFARVVQQFALANSDPTV